MQFRYEVYDPPGIATFVKKIAGLRPLAASGTLYRRQTGRGSFTLPAGYDRLAEIIEVDPSDHSNDVASLIRVYRGTDLIQELLVSASPNIVAEQPAVLACDGIEAVMDWAVVEAWDWDGSADFTSRVPDWIYGGRNLIPELALADLNSIVEEWSLYLSGERYELDTSLATTGDFTLNAAGNDTSAIAFNASASAIKSALEALAGITTVSVIQPDPDTREFQISFENPKDLGSNMTADFTGTGGLGSLTKLNDGFNTGTNPTFTITVDGQTTAALDWDASAAVVEGSPLGTPFGLEGLSNVNDVTVSGSGVLADPYEIAFYDPPDPTSVTVTFAAGTAVLTKIQEGDPDPSPVTVSQSIDASRDPTIHGFYDEPPIQVVTTPLDTGADWSLLVNATGRYAGSQVVIENVTPGQIYQASIRIRPTVTGLYTLVIRDEFENLIKNPSPRDNLLTAGSFQTIEVNDIQIPDGVTRVIMRAAVTDPSSGNWADFYVNWQGAEFREGQAATTLGTIMGHLLDDAQTDHASSSFARSTIDFVNKSFDDSTDTAGNAWADAELSVNIPRGMTYRKVLDRIFGLLGYEWDLTPTSGTPGEWDLNIWNPNGRGTDHTSADTPSLLLGQGTLAGSATKSLPSGNIIISEGAEQYFSRVASSASYGAVGRREWYQADISYHSNQVDEWTDETLDRFLDVSLKPRFEVADPPTTQWPVPVVNYGIADTLNVDLSDGSGKISRAVEAISWRTVDDGIVWGVHTGEAQFDAIGGVGGGSAARGDVNGLGQGALAATGPVDEGVRRLIDAFDRLRRPVKPSLFVPSKGGGAPTVVVAASDASSLSKRKADFICSGTDDEEVIRAAALSLDNDPGGTARILLTEGEFSIGVEGNGLDLAAIGGFGVHVQGMGPGATILSQQAARSAPTGTHAQMIWYNTRGIISDLAFNMSQSGNDIFAIYSDGFDVPFTLRNIEFRDGTGGGVFLNGTSNTQIRDCFFLSLNGWAVVGSGVQNLRVAGNIGNPENGVWVHSDSKWVWVQDNGWIVGGGEGVFFDTVIQGQVTDNFMLEPDNGVHLTDTDQILVQGNQVIDAAGDGVLLDGDSNDNRMWKNDISSDNTTDVGIHIADSTCDCNVVVGNALGDPSTYSVDAIVDSGTNTQLKYPDDPVYGDNFTECAVTPS